MMTGVNFFILGAAKSGTTTLWHYLNQHPDIFLSLEKEPNFYNTGYRIIKTPAEYQALFKNATTEKIIGEASHAYLSDPSCAETLKKHHPDAKFLLILRNPAKRAYSLYNHMLRHGYETISNFEAALEAEPSRINSIEFINRCDENIHNFAYFSSGLYGEQIERYFSLFRKEQFHIIVFDDLIQNTEFELSRIFNYLNLEKQADLPLTKKNSSNLIPISPSLRKWVRLHSTPSSRSLIPRSINYLNTRKTPPLNPITYQTLITRYQDDLNKLRELTGVSF